MLLTIIKKYVERYNQLLLLVALIASLPVTTTADILRADLFRILWIGQLGYSIEGRKIPHHLAKE